MPDTNVKNVENTNQKETPKKHSFFWWEINAKTKDLLDFRYNTQEEIDKLNEEMTTTDDLDEIIQQNDEDDENIQNENEDLSGQEDDKESELNLDLDNNLESINDSKIDDNYISEEEPIEWDLIDEPQDIENKEDDKVNETVDTIEELNNEEKETENEEVEENNEDETWDSVKFFDPFELNLDEDEDDENQGKPDEEIFDPFGLNEDVKTNKSNITSENFIEDSLDNKTEDTEGISEDVDVEEDENNDVVDTEEEDVSDSEENISDDEEDVSENDEDIPDIEYDISENDEDISDDEEDVSDDEEDVSENDEDIPDDNEEDISDDEEDVPESEWIVQKDNSGDDDEKENIIINTSASDDSNQKVEWDKTVNDWKIKMNSATGEIVTKDEIDLEQWQDTPVNEDDNEEYQLSEEEIFEQEPEFFADDELSQQFMHLVLNVRGIFKLERKDWEQNPYFRILWWKTDDSTLEYLFYLIEEDDEPIDLYIKKVETNQENGEENEHLVQFSYNWDKELNIFVDEVILYEKINKSDSDNAEYNDTKTILEKFIFLTENHYDKMKAEFDKQREEKQKKKQLQQIFKGF